MRRELTASEYCAVSGALRTLGWEGCGDWWWYPGFDAGSATLQVAMKVQMAKSRQAMRRARIAVSLSAVGLQKAHEQFSAAKAMASQR